MLKLNKSRRNLLLVLGVFVLPVVLAKFALEQEWFEYGVTNQGALLNQEITLQDLGLSSDEFEDEQWLLLFRVPEECDDLCQKTLLSVNNTYVLLGREIPRVTPVALANESILQDQKQYLKHAKWKAVLMDPTAEKHIASAGLLVVDPLGNIVMSYQAPNEEKLLNGFGKGILADMKKLLKYSRIG